LEEHAGFSLEHSIVLLDNNEIVGLLLARTDRNVSVIGAIVVARRLRGGIPWANAMLMHKSASNALQRGSMTIRFAANAEQNPNTIHAAQLWGARRTGGESRFVLSLS
jgi:hypothetical protein